MNIQSGVDQTGRLIEGVHRQELADFAGISDIEEPTVGYLWEKSSLDFERALAIYDKKEQQDTA